jgi:ferredoxin-NADP reductase
MEYTVRALEVIAHGGSAFSVRFERPAAFSFLPGQYMVITTGTGAAALTKHLTISSSPSDPYLEVTKGSTGHPFAESLRRLKSGDEVAIRGPFGDFTFRGEYGKVAFVAGGIGITPLWSMIRNATENLIDTDITLLYSAKTEQDILFHEVMKDIANANLHLSMVITLTAPGRGWTGHTGRIDRMMIEQDIPDWQDRIFFTSGPPAMVDAMLGILREIGVPEDHIRYEYFPGY